MGFSTSSTRRSTATSAVSNQAVVINSGNTAPAGTTAFTIAGAVSANTTVTIGVVTPGQSSANSSVASSSGPIIANVQYLNANNTVITGANAVSTAGGNILVNGSNFVVNSSVYLNNSLATNTFISSSQIRVIGPAASAGNVTLMIFSPTNTGTVGPNVRYSGVPSWTTAAVSFQNGAAANVALIASSDSTLTYTLQAGSTLPTGISLISSGYLTGTATGYSTNTTGTVVIIATDQEGQAAQQTINWTVTTADPQFNYTTLLLNGETSVTPFINDASTNSFPLTIAGDTKANKFSPYYGDGYYSNYFNGSTDYLSTTLTGGAFGAGDFTIEGWAYATGSTTNNGIFQLAASALPSTISGLGLAFFGTSSTFTWLYAGTQANGGATPVSNTWYHFALSRSGTSLKGFLNGAQVFSATDSTNYTQTSLVLAGYYSTSQLMAGYISNFRIVKGTALYISNFTPSTTPLTAIANTSLLTCQSNRFIDKSTNAFALTVNGTPQVSPAIPFAASSTYATYGSAYFDGTGDYLSIPASTAFAIGTGDYTLEFWVYSTIAFSGTICLYNNNSSGYFLQYNTGTGLQTGVAGSSATGTYAVTLSSTTWNHIAVSRSSGSSKCFVNGTQVGTTVSDTTNYAQNGAYIGALYNGTQPITGYISDLRVIKGTAIYTTTFTPPTAPLSAVANTQLLTLQYNGGANNNGFIDTSPFDFPITRNGTATQGTFSPYSATGWSAYSTGASGAYIYTPSAAWTTLSGTFTVELWVNWSVAPGAATGSFMGVQANGGWTFYCDGSSISPNIFGSGNIFNSTFSPSSIVVGRWYHIAVTRNSSNLMTMWVNGVSVGSATTSTTYTQGSWAIFSPSNVGLLNGYISNHRVTNTCLYTTTFTPSTTPLTAVTGTQLLTCQSNRFVDNSSNANTFTVASTVSIYALSPFAPANAYAPATNGGSMYCYDTAAYTTVSMGATQAFGTGDFTVECWVYNTASSHNICMAATATTSWELLTYGSQLYWHENGGNLGGGGYGSIVLNTWSHFAVSRASGTLKMFINGVQVYSAANTYNYSNNSTARYIGPANGGTAGQYISDFRVINGTALYTAAFTPPAAPLTAVTNTTLLLSCANGGIIDAHATAVLTTASTAQLSTATKKFGTASISFNGTSDMLTIPASPLWIFNTGDFTIEFWMNTADTGAGLITPATTGAGYWALLINSGTLYWQSAYNTTNLKTASLSGYLTNTWVHIAVVRYSGNLYFYFNGTAQGSATADSTNYSGATNTLTIGYDAQGNGYYAGYLDDLRITKGFARYTANFTPPTSAFLGQ